MFSGFVYFLVKLGEQHYKNGCPLELSVVKACDDVLLFVNGIREHFLNEYTERIENNDVQNV